MISNNSNCQTLLYHSLSSQQDNCNNMLLLRSELGQLREQLLKKTEQLKQQQLDMEQLNSKYVAALDQVATIQHEKDLAERELEDLTCRLFEQANVMVANEKREVYRLRTELDRTQQLLVLEKDKYKQLLLQNHQTMEQVSTSSLENNLENSSITPSLILSPSTSDCFQTTISLLDYGGNMEFLYDQQQMQLFQQFIQTLAHKPCLLQNKHHPFMKQCLIGDVEPCLNFGPQNRLASIKKMIDSMLQQPCVLEEMTIESPLPANQTTTTTTTTNNSSSSIGLRWNRFMSGASLVDCAGCGNTLDMHHYYRFRLNEGGDNDWLHLDMPCRDRLMAVCTFFGFLRQFLVKTPIEDDDDHEKQNIDQKDDTMTTDKTTTTTTSNEKMQYMEMIQLRLAMFYARVGVRRSSCWMDDDGLSTISTQGPMTPVASVSKQMTNHSVDGNWHQHFLSSK
ncbi:uncharacterized protein BX664DRAFT_93892 [Halteromyces radiatus]|uniref:uncharacterized protein n=1 Tax=Halteromyces radiatus TaxID=101107 RepID=UPI00222124B2|nr:uncharacterized protein BX664DRAFT_93892 [Halteromyces radiatus]KAI8092757.1 hypothetical protein BX664DRAFT_93892 [Halteromyces radiatus]